MEVHKSNNIYRIRKEGGSRVLAVGKFLPEDWKVVRIRKDPSSPPVESRVIGLVIEKVS